MVWSIGLGDHRSAVCSVPLLAVRMVGRLAEHWLLARFHEHTRIGRARDDAKVREDLRRERERGILQSCTKAAKLAIATMGACSQGLIFIYQQQRSQRGYQFA